jgi:transposase
VSRVDDADLAVGAGTHRDTHTAAICDGRGRVLSQLQVPATPDGYGELLAWAGAAAAGRPLMWAIEGTRHYGPGLARHLAAAGQRVAETGSTRHVGRRRAGRATRSTPSGWHGNCWPGPGLVRCGRMAAGKRCGC